MSLEKEYPIRDSREIGIRDLIFTVLKKWRFIIVCGLALGMFVCLGKYFIHNKTSSNTNKIENEAFVLNENEKLQLKEYYEIKKELQDITIYKEQSILMNINPYNKSQYVLQYKVGYADQNQDMSSIVDNAVDMYMVYILYGGLAEDIEFNGDTDYLNELFKVQYNHNSIENNNCVENFTVIIASNHPESVLNFAEQVKKNIRDYHSIVEQSFGSHELTLISEFSSNSIDLDLKNQQHDIENLIIDLNNRLADLEAGFSKGQLQTLQMENTEQVTSTEKVPTQKSTASVFSIKYFVLGFMLGGIFAVIYTTIILLLKNVIISVEDIEKNYDIRILGHINTLKKEENCKKTIVNKILELQYWEFRNNNFENELLCTCTSIAKLNGNHKYILLDSKDSKIDLNIIDEFAKHIAEIQYIKDIFANIEDLQTFYMSDAVILIENIGYSTHRDLIQKIRRCYDSGKKLIGVVVLN